MTAIGRGLLGQTVVVVGFARTGQAVARVVARHGGVVVAVEDRPDAHQRELARTLGVELVERPSSEELAALVDASTRLVVSPGVPPSHPVFSLPRAEPPISEIELAFSICAVPVVAVTGTNGKTTVTTLVDAMLCHSGLRSTAAGNIGPTLIEAADRDDLDVIVAEVSSFQLAFTRRFQPRVATWLNFAADHLDWHLDLEDYADAKARIFQAQGPDDVAVANADDPVVMSYASRSAARLVTFGRTGGDYHLEGGRFVGPSGLDLGGVDLLARALPHDVDNALAALASAVEAGATPDGCRAALAVTGVLPHRIAFAGAVAGVDFYDDSKATTPSAALVALAAFSSAVLIAGGRNKGLDLSVLREWADAHPDTRLAGVVAIGESAPEVAHIFSPGYRVEESPSMADAVRRAFAMAEPGDAVVLSPGCASFDWYHSYAERGDDFVRCVDALREELEGPALEESQP